MSEEVQVVDETPVWGDFNRAQRRRMRRALHRQHRRETRFWRRAWRGVITQQEAMRFAKEAK